MNTSTVSVDVAGTVVLAFSVAKLAVVSITGSDFSKLTSVVCFVAFTFRKVSGTIGRFYVISSWYLHISAVILFHFDFCMFYLLNRVFFAILGCCID